MFIKKTSLFVVYFYFFFNLFLFFFLLKIMFCSDTVHAAYKNRGDVDFSFLIYEFSYKYEFENRRGLAGGLGVGVVVGEGGDSLAINEFSCMRVTYNQRVL
jgi:hypothetical protein